MRLKIEKLIYGGWGLGRINGRVVLVPYVLPGEEVEVELQKEKKQYTTGLVKEIHKPSDRRCSPPCPVFGQCGGCDYQHIEYATQVQLKQGILREELQRLGGTEGEVGPGVPSPHGYGYRCRIELAVSASDQVRIGYYRRESRELVSIEKCPIAHDLINRTLRHLLPAMERQIHVARTVKRIEIAVSPEEGQGHVIFDVTAHCNEKRLKIMAEEVIAGAGFIKDAFVRHRAFSPPRSLVGIEGMKSTLRFHVGSSSLFCPPGAFFQVNDEQNNRLVRTIEGEIGRQEWESVFELFSGVGNFSIPLSGFAKSWTGIEQDGVAVRNASYNAQFNGLKNLRFLRGAALKVLQKLQKQVRSFDLLLLDPPRKGALEELRVAVAFNPRKIIYVSCNPATLARDLRFLATAGFGPTRILPFDFFPQTFHIESVTFLSPTLSSHN